MYLFKIKLSLCIDTENNSKSILGLGVIPDIPGHTRPGTTRGSGVDLERHETRGTGGWSSRFRGATRRENK